MLFGKKDWEMCLGVFSSNFLIVGGKWYYDFDSFMFLCLILYFNGGYCLVDLYVLWNFVGVF